MTCAPMSYLPDLGVPDTSDYATCDDDDDDDDDDNFDDDVNGEVKEQELAEEFDDQGDEELKKWFAAVKRDPLRRARRLVRLLCSSDSRRQGFRDFIESGNKSGYFLHEDDDGNSEPFLIPQLQLLRDVKMRWDSVYAMLQRLQVLRPVRLSP